MHSIVEICKILPENFQEIEELFVLKLKYVLHTHNIYRGKMDGPLTKIFSILIEMKLVITDNSGKFKQSGLTQRILKEYGT